MDSDWRPNNGFFAYKYRLLGWLGLVLMAGFVATSVASFLVSRQAIHQALVEQALPLTADNVYSEIQKDLLQPVFISSLMAHDTFVRDWLIEGERDETRIIRYLAEVKHKYNTVTSFLVADKSRSYYHAKGVLKKVREGEPRDAWFFRVRSMAADYETNVDPDLANRDAMTVFINYRVLDYDGRFIGATGVGLTTSGIGELLDSYQHRFGRRVFFVNQQGDVVLTGQALAYLRGAISQIDGLSRIASRVIDRNDPTPSLSYARDDEMVLLNRRFIPELGWFLIVEQDEGQELLAVRRAFYSNLAISAVVTLLVLAISLFAANRYQSRLERVATTDSLTGLVNRQAFELLFHQALLDSERSGQALSVILFDIDHFKDVNDSQGHLEGDRVLKAVSQVARLPLRESDIVARWGGEEFLVLLRDCNARQAAAIASKMRAEVSGYDFDLPAENMPLTISLGVAQFLPSDTTAVFFGRADTALYRAKSEGRDRVAVEPPELAEAADWEVPESES